MRLTGAEFASESAITNDARFLFFSAAEDVEPDFLPSLFRDPLRALTELRKYRRVASWADLLALLKYEKAEISAAAQNVLTALNAWAGRWNLRHKWCIQSGFQCLVVWRPGFTPTIVSLLGEDRDPTPPAFDFHFEPWERTVRTRKAYVSDLCASFNEMVKEYCAIVDTGKMRSKLERTPQKSQPLHFEWLARKVVQGWSHEQIRAEYDRSEHRPTAKTALYLKTVRDGVNDAARLVGMIVPSRKRGRPPGVKEHRSRRRVVRRLE
jgi:hypothetical protein